MKLIICIEKAGGMLFGKKRHSQDSILRKKILEMTEGSVLWVSEYTARQFENTESLSVDNDYLNRAEENDYCFIEDRGYDIERANEIVLCKWNRSYPSDVFFNTDLKALGFKKKSTEDIAGSSHKKITIERYVRA